MLCCVCKQERVEDEGGFVQSAEREKRGREEWPGTEGQRGRERDCNGQKAFRGEEKSAAMREKGCKRGEYFLYINIYTVHYDFYGARDRRRWQHK